MSELRERMTRLLKPNGEAGTVEVDHQGEPEFQHFVAQAGPYKEGTQVVVLSGEEAGEILALLNSEPEPDARYVVVTEGDDVVSHGLLPFDECEASIARIMDELGYDRSQLRILPVGPAPRVDMSEARPPEPPCWEPFDCDCPKCDPAPRPAQEDDGA